MGKGKCMREKNSRLVSIARMGVLFCLFALLSSIAPAADPQSGAVLIEQDPYGDFLIAGINQSRATDAPRVSLAKFEPHGGIVWTTTFSATGRLDVADIVTDVNGDVLIAGAFSGALFVGDDQIKSVGDDDLFLIRFSGNGEILWVKRIGGLHREAVFRLNLDLEGNIQVQGTAPDLAFFDGVAMRARNQHGGFLANFDATGQFTGVWWLRQSDVYDDEDLAPDSVHLFGLDALLAPVLFEPAPEPGDILNDLIQLVGEGGTCSEPDPSAPPPGCGGG